MDSHAQARTGKIGRPHGFDRDAAPDAAMRAFWAHGSETTSIADLTAAMGIDAPTRYGAFGEKRRLLPEAAARYLSDAEAKILIIAEAPSAMAAAEFVLHGAVARSTGDGAPLGCLLASAFATGSDDAADVRAAVAAMRDELRASLRARVVSDMEVGLLPPETEADALADGTICLIQGLSASTRDGPDRGRLDAMVRLFLRGWP